MFTNRSISRIFSVLLVFVLMSVQTMLAQAAGVWASTGSMTEARAEYTATLLPTGEVLVAGGDGVDGAELYEPATGVWTATGSMAHAQRHHTATLLPNGLVLVVGGVDISGNSLDSAELYDPATGGWTETDALAQARFAHTATLLATGQVLVVGGVGSSESLAGAELYDPATGIWTETGAMTESRYLHTATLLPNGQVLVSGGAGAFNSAELYDPTTGAWTTTGALIEPRFFHTATLLTNGKVLVVGGMGTSTSSAELYDLGTNAWTATGALAQARFAHTATLLSNGQVLVTGGNDESFNYLDSAELFDPTTGTWTNTSALVEARAYHRATLLSNGQVLVAGGQGYSGYLTSAELYGEMIPLMDQTITVTIHAPDSAAAGDVFTVEAAASSGLPVTFSASGSCSNVDGTFTMDSGSSDCTVMYDQGGDESYNPATQVVEIVTGINSAPVIDEGESVTVTMSQDGTPNAFALTLHAGDQDLDSLNWSISSPASNGTATIPVKSKCDGKKPKNPKDPKLPCKDINYIPTLGYSGNDSFDVQVSDGDLTDTITVNVIIERTNTSVVTLIDSQGNGLAGATVQYYASGWQSIPGSTDADGELSYEDLGLSGNLAFRITYANASFQKQQNVTTDPTVIFQTQLVNMQLLASDGSTELGGEAQYYSNGWRTFGSGSTSTSMELLPLNYTFRVSYGGASIQKQQNIGNDSAIIFQTKSVSMQLLASDNTTELAGTSEYYANGWKTFGGGSTSATMELLPVNYTFRVSYGGASIQKQQDVNINSTVVFQTKLASMQLLASNGATELTGASEYYANGWKTFGGGSTSATMELLPVNYTFRVSYGGSSIQKLQDVNTNTAVVFQTKSVSMQLLASNGTTELAGMSEYYANGWKTFGNGSTTTTMELLPVNYTFRVSYGGASVQKQQDVNANPLVIFQTKLVTMKLLTSNGTTELVGASEYYANGWKTFGNGLTTTSMELLPVNYTFRVSYGGASVQKQQDANANQLIVFQTGQVRSNSAAATQYYANGWKAFVQNMELLPGSYAFKFNDGTLQTTYPLIAGTVNNIH